MEKPKKKYVRHIDPEVAAAKCRAALAQRKKIGRTKGSCNAVTASMGMTMEEPRTNVHMLVRTRDVLKTCAKIDGISVAHFMERLAVQLKTHPRYASAFENN